MAGIDPNHWKKLDKTVPWVKCPPPSVFLIRKRWRDLGVRKWQNRQVLRLAKMLDCTVQEVGALVGLTDRQIQVYSACDKWPVPVSILMLMLTNWYLETQLGISKAPVIPIDLLCSKEAPHD
jgi:hypothetical protein